MCKIIVDVSLTTGHLKMRGAKPKKLTTKKLEWKRRSQQSCFMSLLFDSYIVTLKLFFHFMAVEEEMRKLKTTRLEFPILSYIIVKYCNLFATFKLDQNQTSYYNSAIDVD